jgi:hypothetical protein
MPKHVAIKITSSNKGYKNRVAYTVFTVTSASEYVINTSHSP